MFTRGDGCDWGSVESANLIYEDGFRRSSVNVSADGDGGVMTWSWLNSVSSRC